jgi:hypothetical protein
LKKYQTSVGKSSASMPPMPGKSINLYIVAEDESIGCLLAEDANDGTERAVYHLYRCTVQEIK